MINKRKSVCVIWFALHQQDVEIGFDLPESVRSKNLTSVRSIYIYMLFQDEYFKLCWQSLWNQSCLTRFHTAVLVLLFSPGNTKLQSFWLLCFLKKQDKTQLWEDQIICKVWRTLGICKTVCSLKDYFVDWKEVPSLLWH